MKKILLTLSLLSMTLFLAAGCGKQKQLEAIDEKVISNQISVCSLGAFYLNGYTRNLSYYDFDLNREIVLCDNPNCMHQDEHCNAFFPNYSSITGIAAYGQKLYSFQLDEETNRWMLVQSDINGRNGRILAKLPTGEDGENVVVNNPCIYTNNTVYFTLYFRAADGKTYSQIMEIDLKTGDLDPITERQAEPDGLGDTGYRLLNANSQMILMNRLYYPNGILPQDVFYETYGKDRDYVEFYQEQTRKEFILQPLEQGQEPLIIDNPVTLLNTGTYEQSYQGQFFYAEGEKLLSIDLAAKEETLLYTADRAIDICNVVDGKVFFQLDEDDTLYYYDIEDRTVTPLMPSEDSADVLYPWYETDRFLFCFSAQGYAYISKENFYNGQWNLCERIGFV